jgi:transposase
MVRVLRALNDVIRDLDRSVVARLGEHPDAEIFTSLPRSDRINAAQMLAEWGDCWAAYCDPDAVAALGRSHPDHQEVGQAHLGGLPLGVQQALPQGRHDVRGQLPPRQRMGGQRLRRRDRPWA